MVAAFDLIDAYNALGIFVAVIGVGTVLVGWVISPLLERWSDRRSDREWRERIREEYGERRRPPVP